MLKFLLEQGEYDKLEDTFKALYKQEGDGKWHLQLPESEKEKELNVKITEFRNNNLALKKRTEDFEAKFKDIDPTKFKEMQEKLQTINDQKLLDDGNLEALLEERTERMKADYESRIKILEDGNEKSTKELVTVQGRLSTVLIDSNIRDAVNAVGVVRQNAMEDIVSRGRSVWVLQEGEPVPLKKDGTVLYGPDAKTAMSFSEWAKGLLDSAPFLFEPNSGAGSRGGDPGAGGGGSSDDIKKLPLGERLKALHSTGKA